METNTPTQKYNQNHPGYYRESNLVRIERNRQFFRIYLQFHPCACGESDPKKVRFFSVLTGEKNSKVKSYVGSTASMEALQAELGKCYVQCRTCRKQVIRETYKKAA